jgi:hypothetical protein
MLIHSLNTPIACAINLTSHAVDVWYCGFDGGYLYISSDRCVNYIPLRCVVEDNGIPVEMLVDTATELGLSVLTLQYLLPFGFVVEDVLSQDDVVSVVNRCCSSVVL